MKVAAGTAPVNQRAWLLAAPAAALLLACLGLPLVLLAAHTAFGPSGAFVADRTFGDVLQSEAFWLAAARSLGLALGALALELPLGLALALAAPRRGWSAGLVLSLMALPLMIPPAAGGLIWKAFAFGGGAPLGLGETDPLAAWSVLLAMDVWRWTGLVALLVYGALARVPEAMQVAARIDGAGPWSVFRHVQLPYLWRALGIAALLRFADSLLAFAEAATLTAGGPKGATTLLGLELRRLSALPDAGAAAAAGLLQVVVMLLAARVAFGVLAPRKAARP